MASRSAIDALRVARNASGSHNQASEDHAEPRAHPLPWTETFGWTKARSQACEHVPGA
eukprot:CAMPEP_0114566952 /NCGR_PEP_ID=MMETSP0114-20121206/15192_1 /TAXON_ID=31324 /ORGANISM="Goniomonas sp, Strain m" /LENGTH=57 /DNA_ID=CAMNT_0001753449 /DNA_START=657 /DNA_END=830 /DNA_ORIENTATION=-